MKNNKYRPSEELENTSELEWSDPSQHLNSLLYYLKLLHFFSITSFFTDVVRLHEI